MVPFIPFVPYPHLVHPRHSTYSICQSRRTPRRAAFTALVLALGLAGQFLLAQVPSVISYQGRVKTGGSDFTGTGQFKFALIDATGANTFWSNDNSSSAGAEPVRRVSFPVAQGLFSAFLGDASVTNMATLPSTVFTNADLWLRIWFNDGTNGFARLSPDQRLGAAPYALMAANFPDGVVTSTKLASGAVLPANLANGAVTSAKLAPNSVTIPAILDGSITAAKLAPGAITASAIADGTISQAKLNFQLGYLNARNPPYGAKGDGVTDDSAAIQAALNDAGKGGGGIVFLPSGDYAIRSHLLVPAQTSLSGIWRAPAAFTPHQGTVLLATSGAGSTSGVPFITLQGDNSTLEGVTIYYPNQALTNRPIAYPWAIRAGGGVNVTVQNVLLVNPYLGIDLATFPSGRHFIRGVYGQPLLVGIAVDQCYDIGRIMDVHFWPFWTGDTRILTFQSANAVTFDFMRTDWEVVQDVFSWGYHIGARFRASTNGAMNGQMSNINFDNVDIGLQLSATQPCAIHIANLNLANAGGGTQHIGIQALPGASQLNVSGLSFWGDIYQAVSWGSSGLLTLSNARVLNWSPSKPAITILQGRAVLQGNYFMDNLGTAIHIGPAVNHVMILGNMLAGNVITGAGTNTLSANNQP